MFAKNNQSVNKLFQSHSLAAATWKLAHNFLVSIFISQVYVNELSPTWGTRLSNAMTGPWSDKNWGMNFCATIPLWGAVFEMTNGAYPANWKDDGITATAQIDRTGVAECPFRILCCIMLTVFEMTNRVYWRNWKDDEIVATAQTDWTGATGIAHSDCFTLVLTPHANSLIALLLFTHLMLTNWWCLIKNPEIQCGKPKNWKRLIMINLRPVLFGCSWLLGETGSADLLPMALNSFSYLSTRDWAVEVVV